MLAQLKIVKFNFAYFSWRLAYEISFHNTYFFILIDKYRTEYSFWILMWCTHLEHLYRIIVT